MKLHVWKEIFFSVSRGKVFNYLANEPWLKLCDIILNWDGIYYINERVDSLLCNYWWPELVYRVLVEIFGTVLFPIYRSMMFATELHVGIIDPGILDPVLVWFSSTFRLGKVPETPFRHSDDQSLCVVTWCGVWHMSMSPGYELPSTGIF